MVAVITKFIVCKNKELEIMHHENRLGQLGISVGERRAQITNQHDLTIELTSLINLRNLIELTKKMKIQIIACDLTVQLAFIFPPFSRNCISVK